MNVVCFAFFTIVCGGLFFDEFKFSSLQTTCFTIGIFLIFSGVCALAPDDFKLDGKVSPCEELFDDQLEAQDRVEYEPTSLRTHERRNSLENIYPTPRPLSGHSFMRPLSEGILPNSTEKYKRRNLRNTFPDRWEDSSTASTSKESAYEKFAVSNTNGIDPVLKIYDFEESGDLGKMDLTNSNASTPIKEIVDNIDSGESSSLVLGVKSKPT